MHIIGQPKLAAKVLEQLLQAVAYAGLERLFKAVESKLKEGESLDLGEISENGLDYRHPHLSPKPTENELFMLEKCVNEEKEKARSARDSLLHQLTSVLVVHLDECQVLR
jgi:hypothetical protein